MSDAAQAAIVPAKPIPEVDFSKLPRDLALIKLENDNVMTMAANTPRNMPEILASLKQQVQMCRSFAEKAMYCKPVGKDRDTGQMKFARGLSVRAAEALATEYGFNKVRTHLEPVGDDMVRVVVTFIDYQRGRFWESSGLCSKTYTSAAGRTVRHSDDRFFNTVIKAEISRHVRECILRCVPPGLKSELERFVDEQVDSYLDDTTVRKILAQFAGKDIAQERLEEYMGKRIDAFTKQDRETLLGLWNAVDQGEVPVSELFPPKEGQSESRTEQLVTKLKPRSADEPGDKETKRKAQRVKKQKQPNADDGTLGLGITDNVPTF